MGFSSLAFKVLTADTSDNLFIIGHHNLTPGAGPALHLHYVQEEWFYVMKGEVVLLVGEQRLHHRTGESVLERAASRTPSLQLVRLLTCSLP